MKFIKHTEVEKALSTPRKFTYRLLEIEPGNPSLQYKYNFRYYCVQGAKNLRLLSMFLHQLSASHTAKANIFITLKASLIEFYMPFTSNAKNLVIKQ